MAYHLDFTAKAKTLIFTKRQVIKSFSKNYLEELTEHPFTGTGRPEPLKHNLSGMWSRRMNKEHRLIYEVVANTVFILSAKGHYE
ncbi:Txe/YoeB family addiction module toxin [uncultured Proteiniphilum sp.]|uniref:Txe/YoeB family addiction module toxin n=1 Tax=uncultured Proteiniphilum sp. TaxID=497637 RepID=UPI00261DAB13|nr:Txe/YoeB family addiction module toxin [uncultured Proteiniphilum sp.]